MNPEHTPAHRPRRAGLIAGVAAGAVVLVAASVGLTLAATRSTKPTPAAQQQAQPPAATSGAAPTAPATSAAVAPPVQAALKFGAKAEGAKATVVAYAYKQPVAKNSPKPDVEGFEWGAADIEVCVKVDGAISRASWRLVYADHTAIDPSGTGYGGFPAPEYPWDEQQVTAGDCVRGWLTFAVPSGKKPITVRYQPSSMRAEWQVS